MSRDSLARAFKLQAFVTNDPNHHDVFGPGARLRLAEEPQKAPTMPRETACETCGTEGTEIWCKHCEAVLNQARLVPRLVIAGTGQAVDLEHADLPAAVDGHARLRAHDRLRPGRVAQLELAEGRVQGDRLRRLEHRLVEGDRLGPSCRIRLAGIRL